jgi:hypothetical protein
MLGEKNSLVQLFRCGISLLSKSIELTNFILDLGMFANDGDFSELFQSFQIAWAFLKNFSSFSEALWIA